MTQPSKTFLEIIGARFPALKERIEKGAGGQRSDLGKIRSKSNDWDGLLERWLEGLDLKANAAVALTGFGDGSHVEALMKVLPAQSCVFCVEENVNQLVAACKDERVCRLLEDRRLFVGCGVLDQDCFESLSRFPLLEVQAANPVIFAPLFNGSSSYYAQFFQEFARSFDYWRTLFGTNVTASGKWQGNTLENFPILGVAPDIEVLRNSFVGRTMILVSAGPSLDESIEFVRNNSESCVVVAVNSSYRALRNAGIVPHFVLAADPNEHTGKGFDGVDTDETVLLCPFIVFPDVVKRFSGRIATWSGTNLLANYGRKKGGQSSGSYVVEMGTVSACAFDFAILFGCERLVFVGQDLAARSDGQMHATDSFYEELGSNSTDVGKCRMMKGNTLEAVPVEEKLYVYLKVFEALAKKYGSQIELINTSRLGARVEGIPYKATNEVGTFAFDHGASMEQLMVGVRRRLSDPVMRRNVIEAFFDEFEEFSKKLCSLSLKGALKLETAGKGLPSQEVLSELMECRSELLHLMERNEDIFEVIKDGALKYELVLYARSKVELEKLDESEAELKDLLEYLWAVAEGSFAFLKSIERARC